MHTDTNETMEEVDAVEEFYGDVCTRAFLDANIGESSTSQGPMTGTTEDLNSFS